jgi:hypothetical protein
MLNKVAYISINLGYQNTILGVRWPRLVPLTAETNQVTRVSGRCFSMLSTHSFRRAARWLEIINQAWGLFSRSCALGLYRLCLATCEQLLEFWATFSLSSNLEQLLVSGATYDCLSTKWATFNLFKHRMNIGDIKRLNQIFNLMK